MHGGSRPRHRPLWQWVTCGPLRVPPWHRPPGVRCAVALPRVSAASAQRRAERVRCCACCPAPARSAAVCACVCGGHDAPSTASGHAGRASEGARRCLAVARSATARAPPRADAGARPRRPRWRAGCWACCRSSRALSASWAWSPRRSTATCSSRRCPSRPPPRPRPRPAPRPRRPSWPPRPHERAPGGRIRALAGRRQGRARDLPGARGAQAGRQDRGRARGAARAPPPEPAPARHRCARGAGRPPARRERRGCAAAGGGLCRVWRRAVQRALHVDYGEARRWRIAWARGRDSE